GDLEQDPNLTTADDPDTAGTAPYVDAALLTRMRDWVETTSLAAPNLALRYALQPVSDCLPIGPSSKSPGIVEFGYDRAIPYWSAIFPLLTKHVLHTDRLFLNRNGILGHITAGHTGMGLTEGVVFRPAVRWSSASNSLDGLAISCNWLSYDGTAFGAFLHHLNLTPLPLDLSLDEGLVPGRYQVELGPALAKCDEFPLGSSAVIVQKCGAGATVPLLVPPGLSLVRVTRLGPPDQPSQRWDLALDPPRMTLGSSLELRARVVNAGAASSPPATLRLYATLLNLEGQAIWPGYTKLLFSTSSVPALAGSNGYALASFDASGVLPLSTVVALLLTGLGLEIEAEVTADPLEWDPLNNGLSRRFYLPDLDAVVHPN
ncbi:MAG TPA: hypothetical protein VES36_10135, partial [Candidatus Limnocylindrales bacterium]|nr:hypothetical protein [Candidatus Limnocylindrales bacterium]